MQHAPAPIQPSCLASWRTLNKYLISATEMDCHRLIAQEAGGQCRLQFLNRIHGAYAKKRYARERQELVAIVADKDKTRGAE